ncbi:MAG TPA: hypothetical protein VGJ46_09605 [Candidatus Limnocylindrales bacterium]
MNILSPRGATGRKAVAEAWKQGEAMSLDEVVAYAAGVREPAG